MPPATSEADPAPTGPASDLSTAPNATQKAGTP